MEFFFADGQLSSAVESQVLIGCNARDNEGHGDSNTTGNEGRGENYTRDNKGHGDKKGNGGNNLIGNRKRKIFTDPIDDDHA